MKILAIRGRNIASLAGTFEVDFRVEPLASAGLFAICGPTGSGKSSLLDAMCLALYDRTPRLQKAARQGVNLPDVADDTITQQDARNLLRRGTGEGWAEVEFIGGDGEAYRARWAVRRARSRVDGRLQSAEMSVVRLSDGQVTAGLKTEVLSTIEQRLGLTFDQFTRAVLLAQNEFTAFLQADDNTRASLLEQLTGTDIYTSLSMQAFERARTEQQGLEALLLRRADFQPLAADVRASIERRATESGAAATQQEAAVRKLDEHLRWHGEFDAAAALEEQATRDHAEASQRREQASERRVYLSRVESVQPAAARLKEHDRTAADVRASREESLPIARREAQRAVEAAATSEAELQAAHRTAASAEENLRIAMPGLDQARQLDVQVRELEDKRTAAEKERDRLATAEAAVRAELSEAATEHASHVAARQAADEWLDEHASLRVLADDWLRWDTLYRQAAAFEAEAADGRRRAAEAREVVLSRTAMHEAATRRRVEAEEELARARREFDARQAAAAGFDLESIRTQRVACIARRDQLTRGQQLDAKRADIGRSLASLEENLEAQVAAIDSATRRVSAIADEKRLASAALQQAERAHEEASLASAKSIAKLREGLEAGRPCPVCGSTDHPFVSHEPALDSAAVKVLKQQLRACQAAVERLSSAETEQRTLAATAKKRHEEIARDLEKLSSDRAEVEAQWRAEAAVAEVAHLPEPARTESFARQLSEVSARVTQLDDAEKDAHAAAAARDAARAVLETARAVVAESVRSEDAAARQLVAANGAADAASEAVRRAEEQRDRVLADLDPVGGEAAWRAAWVEGPEAFRQFQERRAVAYREKQESRRQSADATSRLDVRIEGLTRAAATAAAELRRGCEALERAAAELGEKRSLRQMLFDGRPVADVQRELDEAIASARAAVESRRAAMQRASAEQAAAGARLQEAERVLREREQAADESRREATAWLEAYNAARLTDLPLDLDGLRALLSHDAAWLEGERNSVHALDAAFQRTETILHERRERRLAIEGGRPTDEPAEALRATRGERIVELEKLTAARIEAEAEIRKDDENRRKAEDLAADIERQRAAAAIWSRMNELIGSADGKKFRNYAQQLTLDVLLGYANHHLADLARRYTLRRLEDRLALIVVDRDMADEVRSVYSLSGGESFLVSLALALGLASLSANRVRVESLFIDEGFGTLDPETLSISMDALDRLHAQGRKVGVISHVQELAERIGTQVRVERHPGGSSRIVIAG